MGPNQRLQRLFCHLDALSQNEMAFGPLCETCCNIDFHSQIYKLEPSESSESAKVQACDFVGSVALIIDVAT